MQINTTNKTFDNVYFTNTENVAQVLVTRLFDSTDEAAAANNGAFTQIVIEDLGTILDILPQSIDATTGEHHFIDDPITFSGNVISITGASLQTTVKAGKILKLLVVGKR